VIDFDDFDVMSFDCYGTLIDWERGIAAALAQLLELYAGIEARLEQSYLEYRQVLARVVVELGRKLGFSPAPGELSCLAESVGTWPPFGDTVAALKALRQRYRLAVISNIDDDLFEQTARRLGVDFDWVITAQQCRAYKPSPAVFRFAYARIGVAKERIVHVAQSIYHDVIPAKALGQSTVWVNRRGKRPGFGATPPAQGQPDLEVPDLATLASLVEAA
jgi:2-haloacid dehalogenase